MVPPPIQLAGIHTFGTCPEGFPPPSSTARPESRWGLPSLPHTKIASAPPGLAKSKPLGHRRKRPLKLTAVMP